MSLKRIAIIAPLLFVVVHCHTAFADAPPNANASGTMKFLSLDEAKAAIVDDSAEPYFEKLVPIEMSAKTGKPITGDTLDAQRKECKARYQAACLAFTDAEQAAFTKIVEKIRPAIAKELPRFAEQPWSFLKVASTLEGGMPHTRGGHIVMPAVMVQVLSMADPIHERVLARARRLFVHEQTHVIERAYPERFTKLFENVLGFQRAKSIELDPWLIARQVINPDTTECPWVFPIKSDDRHSTRWIWPLIAFADTNATSLRQMQMEGFDLEQTSDGNFKVKHKAGSDEPIHESLRAIEPYMKAIYSRSSVYHPNEIAADLLPMVVEGNAPEAVRAWAVEAFGPAAKK